MNTCKWYYPLKIEWYLDKPSSHSVFKKNHPLCDHLPTASGTSPPPMTDVVIWERPLCSKICHRLLKKPLVDAQLLQCCMRKLIQALLFFVLVDLYELQGLKLQVQQDNHHTIQDLWSSIKTFLTVRSNSKNTGLSVKNAETLDVFPFQGAVHHPSWCCRPTCCLLSICCC